MDKESRLVEGQYYTFIVQKKINIPEEGTSLILKSPGGRKYLLKESMYSDYGLEVGQSVSCRVDKINCVGEIFLEPANPWYREGESYMFTVVGVDVRTDENGKDHECLTVKDERGRLHKVFTKADQRTPAPGEKIRLTVKRIAKGSLTLANDSESDPLDHLVTGQKYRFTIEGIGKAIDGRDNYIVTDPSGKSHIIPVRYYHYYGLNVGSSFEATIETSNSAGKKVIEPENPWYRKDTKVEVQVNSVEPDITQSRFLVKATDRLGRKHDIISDSEVLPGTYYAEVIKMRKGRPVLRLLMPDQTKSAL